MKKTLKEEKLSCDVLIVGAGAGGMMAAISAAENGAKVILCEKGNVRRSGGLPGGNDHFYVYIPEIHGPEVRESAIRDSLAIGMADEDTVRAHLDLTYDVLKKWESWGAEMKINGHYEFVGHGWPGSSGRMGEPGKTDRLYMHFFDNKLSVKLEKQVRDRGVRIMNRTMITDLLRDSENRIAGAIGISTRESEFYVIKAKTVILNKSMGARLFPPPSLMGLGMARPGTGDQAIMAYRAGTEIQGAEFSNRIGSLRFGPEPGRGTWIGVIRDNDGNPIAPPYLTKPDLELGDMSVMNGEAMEYVWKMGRGPVWMDTRGISEDDEQYMRKGFQSEACEALLNWIDEEGIDIKKTRFEFTGGNPGGGWIQVRSNVKTETNIIGLYSIASGLLSFSGVRGMLAGEQASRFAETIKLPTLTGNRKQITHYKKEYESILNREGTEYADWREVQWAIFQTMFSYATPPLRTEATLMTGYRQLIRLRDKAKRLLQADNQHNLHHCLEVLNQFDIAELLFLAVMERKESRGHARRLDYPHIDPRLNNKFIVITRIDGKPQLRYESPKRG